MSVSDALLHLASATLLAIFFQRVIRSKSSFIYDTFILNMTKVWYECVILRVAPASAVLDIGVGNASSLLENLDLLKKKEIKVTVSTSFLFTC